MSKYIKPEDKLKIILSNPVLYAESFIKIVDKNGQTIPFQINQMQRRIEEESGRYNICLKSRQGGASTWIMLRAIYECMTKPNTCCLLLSMDSDSTRAVFNKLKQAYQSINPLVAVKDIRNNRQELSFENGSIITVATMGGKKDKGRGSTFDLIHCSEFAFIDSEMAYKQLTSLEQCLNNNGQIFLESTANGFNHYKEIWEKAINGFSSYTPMFFSYLDVADMHKEQHKQAMDIFEKKNKKPFTEDLLTTEEKQLMANDERFTLPILCWRRQMIANIGIEGFRQEYPLEPLEAFRTSGSSIFENKKIHERLLYLPKPIKDSNIPYAISKYMNSGLEVYRLPVKGERYLIGCDSSEGIGQDYSTICVLNQDCEHFLQFRNNKIQPHELAELLLEICKFYNNGLLGIDKASSGQIVLSKFKTEYRYINVAKSKTFDMSGKTKKKQGIEINAKTRPLIINTFREYFDKDLVQINSKEIYNEMLSFVADSSGKIQHQKGGHDDSLFSIMLAVYLLDTGHPFYI